MIKAILIVAAMLAVTLAVSSVSWDRWSKSDLIDPAYAGCISSNC
jgi:hypothetical protein